MHTHTHTFFTAMYTWTRKTHFAPGPAICSHSPGRRYRGIRKHPPPHRCTLDVARQPRILPFRSVCVEPGSSASQRGGGGRRTPSRLRIGVVCDAGRVEKLQEEAHLTARQSIHPTPAEVAPFNPIEAPPFPRSRIDFRRSASSQIPNRAPVKFGGVVGQDLCLGDLRDQRQ